MAEEFDKAFDKTGAGSDVNQQSKSSADLSLSLTDVQIEIGSPSRQWPVN